MASPAVNSGSPPPLDPAESLKGITCSRATDVEREQVLALLLTGRATHQDPSVGPFISFAKDHRLCLDELWTARRHGNPVAALLLVPSPGRTAMVFVSPMGGAATGLVVAGLVQAVCSDQDPSRTRLLQALLDPQQRREAKTLETAGFKRLSELIYMERAVDVPPTPLDLDDSFEVLQWSDRNRDCFAEAILASYEQTLDCPDLVGLRHIDDIIAGHMATGVFHRELWCALRHGGQPVAVMLLNMVPPRRSMELVYLGISVAWRGRGLGRKLLRHGIGLAGRYGAVSMILAVDRRNKPALRIYRSDRFTSTARKVALIYRLGE